MAGHGEAYAAWRAGARPILIGRNSKVERFAGADAGAKWACFAIDRGRGALRAAQHGAVPPAAGGGGQEGRARTTVEQEPREVA